MKVGKFVVYRIEKMESGYGPFQSADHSYLMGLMPTIETESGCVNRWDHFGKTGNNSRYAFGSLHQLQKWVNEKDRRDLANKGYVLREYLVPASENTWQYPVNVLFDERESEEGRQMDLVSASPL